MGALLAFVSLGVFAWAAVGIISTRGSRGCGADSTLWGYWRYRWHCSV